MTANEVVVFPDAGSVVIEWLADQLPDFGHAVDVVGRVPNPRPAQFVLVRRIGGVRQTIVSDAAMLLVESWADDEPSAHDLAQVARGLVHAMQGTVKSGVPVYRVQEIAGPAVLPDPTSDQSRVTFTIQVQLRGTAASGETS